MDQIGELEQGWSRAGWRAIVRSTLQNNQLVPGKRQHVCWYKERQHGPSRVLLQREEGYTVWRVPCEESIMLFSAGLKTGQ